MSRLIGDKPSGRLIGGGGTVRFQLSHRTLVTVLAVLIALEVGGAVCAATAARNPAVFSICATAAVLFVLALVVVLRTKPGETPTINAKDDR